MWLVCQLWTEGLVCAKAQRCETVLLARGLSLTYLGGERDLEEGAGV